MFLLRPPDFLSIRRGDLLTYINLRVRVIYLDIDNIKRFILKLKKKSKKITVMKKLPLYVFLLEKH